VRFLRDPANVANTASAVPVVIGHSFGGFLAAYEGSHDPDIRAIAMISAVNLGKINIDPKERQTRLKRWDTQLQPVRGVTATELFAEAEQHAKRLGLYAVGGTQWNRVLCCSSKLTIRIMPI